MNGWFSEPQRHSLAARGIKTSYFAGKKSEILDREILKNRILERNRQAQLSRDVRGYVPHEDASSYIPESYIASAATIEESRDSRSMDAGERKRMLRGMVNRKIEEEGHIAPAALKFLGNPVDIPEDEKDDILKLEEKADEYNSLANSYDKFGDVVPEDRAAAFEYRMLSNAYKDRAKVRREELKRGNSYMKKKQIIPIIAEKADKGRIYPVSPDDVEDFLHDERPSDVMGLTAVRFVNPRNDVQRDAYAQYARGKREIRIFSQPKKEITLPVHLHVKNNVLKHENGHHLSLYRRRITDKDLRVAEARADAHAAGYDVSDMNKVKIFVRD
jgi:hypothetical protein